MLGGYDEEARAWIGWLRRAVASAPAEAQIMYGGAPDVLVRGRGIKDVIRCGPVSTGTAGS
jgi:hypothetical protein